MNDALDLVPAETPDSSADFFKHHLSGKVEPASRPRLRVLAKKQSHMPGSVFIPASNELKLALASLIWLAVSNDPDTIYNISAFLNSQPVIESFLDSVELECPANLLGILESAVSPIMEFFESMLFNWVLDWTREYWAVYAMVLEK